MKRDHTDLPKELAYFVTDTGDAVHGYSGPLRDEHQERRAREHYPVSSTVERMWIGRYKLVAVEEVPIRRKRARSAT